jgi:hypothetical protein
MKTLRIDLTFTDAEWKALRKTHSERGLRHWLKLEIQKSKNDLLVSIAEPCIVCGAAGGCDPGCMAASEAPGSLCSNCERQIVGTQVWISGDAFRLTSDGGTKDTHPYCLDCAIKAGVFNQAGAKEKSPAEEPCPYCDGQGGCEPSCEGVAAFHRANGI